MTDSNVFPPIRTDITRIVLYDLDSTIANVHHREHLAPIENRDQLESWIDYSKGCVDDTVVEGVAASARIYFDAGVAVGFVSGRNDEAVEETIAWLAKNQIPWDRLKLHKEEDPRHNAEHKIAYIKFLQDLGYTVELMYEDHISVCEKVEEQTGVPCITVRPRYDDSVGVSFNLNQHPATQAAQ